MIGSVPTSEMHFCGEPTADGDMAAEYLRHWYEANRETWWDRRKRPPLNNPWADNLMLGLYDEVLRIEEEKQRQINARASNV
jgi:hypothetical protein